MESGTVKFYNEQKGYEFHRNPTMAARTSSCMRPRSNAQV